MHLFLPYFIILLILLQHILRRSTNRQSERNQAFWDREAKANTVRKKDIINLNYITIPAELSLLNSGNIRFDEIYYSDNTLQRCYDMIMSLKNEKILNLTGISNTDLKLSYGVANLTALTEYDDNFIMLVKNLASIGHILIDYEDYNDALLFLEFGIRIGTDIRSNYFDLADYYSLTGNIKGLDYLKQKAAVIKSLNKDIILKKLNEYNY